MRTWVQEGDVVIVDRGYRDSVPLLNDLGLTVHIPPFLNRNENQYTAIAANKARLISSTRWVVEARNGHLKSIFKFFRQTILAHHAANLHDIYLIAGTLINKYHPLIEMEGTV